MWEKQKDLENAKKAVAKYEGEMSTGIRRQKKVEKK